MKIQHGVFKISLLLISLSVITAIVSSFSVTHRRRDDGVIAAGSAGNLQRRYQRWAADYGATSHGQLAVGLVWNKGFSTEYSRARGIALIDLKTGRVRVKVANLDDHRISEIWLLDTQDGPDHSAQPGPGDRLMRVGSLRFRGDDGRLGVAVDIAKLRSMEVNWVVLTRRGSDPVKGGVLFGSTSLFQKIYHYPEHALADRRDGEARNAGAEFGFIGSAQANGILPSSYPNADLINEGRQIFFNETFNGNGRTCGTCHREDNNHTIDPKYIATLPPDDPLFVAERPAPNPLAQNFEKPELMHKVGLILENTNGFNDLAHNYTMRGVPHLLALRTSVSPPSPGANDGTTVPPDQRLGWSGDGSPVDLTVSPQLRGTLRDFAVGSVKQHFTKTLNRVAGVDFRLPTEHELDALEAYMLSLGRQQEFDDFNTIRLTDARAEQGRRNYLGEGLANGVPCNACHFNGGANTDPNFDFPPSISPPAFESSNRSFAPRVEELLDQPGDVVDGANNPFDDGFGSGTNLFNVPTVIEAADTGPFFHANQIDTVEGVVAFYASQRHLRDGTVLAPIVGLNGSQVVNVAAFMRVLNADENARSAIALIDQAGQLDRLRDKLTDLQLARDEVEDAIEVLEAGHLHFSDAVPLFKQADLLAIAPNTAPLAKAKLQQARAIMVQR
ncbi:MAG TPA: hypothetical protein VEI24_03390 [Nitrospiria bacterium]|nr:hypothetical protein [Nitrospiria bacterium]